MPDDYPLGRVQVDDIRDSNFPMSLEIGQPSALVLPKQKTWRGQPPRLNQGQRGACVGFTGANWMGHLPIYDRVSDTIGHALYDECKKIDGIPHIEGTYDRALAQVLVAQGRIERYLWAQSPDELKAWILTTGSVMVGTPWYSEMFNPDSKHRLWISGPVVGGHEYLVKGWERKHFNEEAATTGYYRIRNSWGPHWGDNGEAWIKEDLLYRLVFQEGGDALGAVEKRP